MTEARIPAPEAIEPLTKSFSRLLRTASRMKQQMIASSRDDVEWTSHQLIATVIHDGPLRASALAELVQSDPSTVSRQVATLIKDGFLERQIDPRDGRASLLVATLQGRNVFNQQTARRNERFALILDGWTDEECRDFAGYMDRLTDAFIECRPQFLAEASAHGRSGESAGSFTTPVGALASAASSSDARSPATALHVVTDDELAPDTATSPTATSNERLDVS